MRESSENVTQNIFQVSAAAPFLLNNGVQRSYTRFLFAVHNKDVREPHRLWKKTSQASHGVFRTAQMVYNQEQEISCVFLSHPRQYFHTKSHGFTDYAFPLQQWKVWVEGTRCLLFVGVLVCCCWRFRFISMPADFCLSYFSGFRRRENKRDEWRIMIYIWKTKALSNQS